MNSDFQFSHTFEKCVMGYGGASLIKLICHISESGISLHSNRSFLINPYQVGLSANLIRSGGWQICLHPKFLTRMRFWPSFFAGYLKLTLYLQHPCISMDLGHNKGQKRAKCLGHIDGRPTHGENCLFWFLADPVAKFGWIVKKLVG